MKINAIIAILLLGSTLAQVSNLKENFGFNSLSNGGTSQLNNFDDGSYINELMCDSAEGPCSYLYLPDAGNSYNLDFMVTLKSGGYSGIGNICFGYMSQEGTQEVRDNPSNFNYEMSSGLCLDNTQNNKDGGQIYCSGFLPTAEGTIFIVRNAISSLSIESGDYYCLFPRFNDGADMTPWVEIDTLYNIETAFINKPEVIEPTIPDFEPTPETTEVLVFEPTPVIEGGDPSTWAPETTEVLVFEPTPLIMGGDPRTWAPETTPLPLYDCENPHPPAGDCSILYAECAFKGCFQLICADTPQLDQPFKVGSLYVPAGYTLNLWSESQYQAYQRTFTESNICIEYFESSSISFVQTKGKSTPKLKAKLRKNK